MTSHQDEITNLRTGLEHIRQWCVENAEGCPDPGAKMVFDAVRAKLERTLKTPRTSKIAPESKSRATHPHHE